MTPFTRAKYRLTAWYMLIFTIILIIFTYLTFNAKESAFVRVYTVVDQYDTGGEKTVELNQKFEEYNRIFRKRVLIFDIVLWFIGLVLSYRLSEKTLEPIHKMLLEQELFASDVSHGLRTPLATMGMEVEAFLRTQRKITLPTRRLLKSVLEEIAYLTRITEGVLSLTRVKGKQPVGQVELVDLKEVLKKTVSNFTAAVKLKESFIKYEILEAAKVTGNQDQLKQVITILLDNALKYGGKGVKITISLQKHKSYAEIKISDNGPGIAKSDLSRIFSRFYRGTSTQGMARGAGLGLAVANKIMEAHNGSIRVQSKLGQGTTFRLVFLGSS